MVFKIPIYQVDAFTSTPFSGNPAAVCLMDMELPDSILQSIASENNLAETAFIWPQGDRYKIRWFTPSVEVDLCGHATLASAHVLFTQKDIGSRTICFDSRSGLLFVEQNEDGLLTLDFPVDLFQSLPIPDGLEAALGTDILDCVKGKSDYLVRIKDQNTLQNIQPNLSLIKTLPARGLIVTAPGDHCDFVSRCFFPQSGIDEDPVTGSAHTTLTPYWADILKKRYFVAKQLSARGGTLNCEMSADRVLISGNVVLFLEGTIFVSL